MNSWFLAHDITLSKALWGAGDEDADAAAHSSGRRHHLPGESPKGRAVAASCAAMCSGSHGIMPATATSAERGTRRAVQVPEGSVINSGDLIARLELDDPGAVTAAVPYPGGFPELGPPLVHSQGVDHRFKEAYAAAKMIMAGAQRTHSLCDAVAALFAHRQQRCALPKCLSARQSLTLLVYC